MKHFKFLSLQQLDYLGLFNFLITVLKKDNILSNFLLTKRKELSLKKFVFTLNFVVKFIIERRKNQNEQTR